MSNGSPPPPPPPSSQPGPASYTPPAPAASGTSGLPVWAKVGIGCGCLVLLVAGAGIVLLGWGVSKVADVAQEFEKNPSKAAETLINLHPDLEVVENHPEDGRITFRNTKTGETGTADYSEIKSGKFTFEGDQGKVELGGDSGLKVTDAEGKETFKATSDPDGQGLRITTPDGETRIGGGTKDIPSWVPRHPSIELESAGLVMTQQGKASGLVGAKSDLSLEDLEEWYTRAMKDGGFEIDRRSINYNNQSQIILAGKQEGYDSLTVTLNDSEGERQIAITYAGPAD